MPFRSRPRTGYIIEFAPAHRGEEGHRFCGPHHVDGAWCPNCDRPLLLYFAIACRDSRVELAGFGEQLCLFYCWRCNLAQEPFFYRVLDSDRIQILRFGAGGVEEDFPYADYPVWFPGAPARLVMLSSESQGLLEALNAGHLDEGDIDQSHPDLCRPRHQLGGEPYLVQKDPAYSIACPECRLAIPFLAAFADDCVDPRGFVGEPYVQVLFHVCRACRVVGAIQQCD